MKIQQLVKSTKVNVEDWKAREATLPPADGWYQLGSCVVKTMLVDKSRCQFDNICCMDFLMAV